MSSKAAVINLSDYRPSDLPPLTYTFQHPLAGAICEVDRSIAPLVVDSEVAFLLERAMLLAELKINRTILDELEAGNRDGGSILDKVRRSVGLNGVYVGGPAA